MNKFTIALVGKPNVGKSTLFNRLSRKRLAIVDDFPGVTRDWKIAEVTMAGRKCQLIDTAGWEVSNTGLAPAMRAHTQDALAQAQLVVLLLDGKQGITRNDLDFVKTLRHSGKAVLVVVNKCEGKTQIDNNEVYRLGFDEPIHIAAREGLGLLDLEEAIKDIIKAQPVSEDDSTEDADDKGQLIRLAIVGRPNVGKSTIFNQILGMNRSIVSAEEGTTRDAISHAFHAAGCDFELIDTAGLRRKNKISEDLEGFMVRESINTIRRAHVVALIISADAPLEKQELQIANVAINEGKGLILVANKMDLLTDKKAFISDIRLQASHELYKMHNLPIVFVQANSGRNVTEIFKTAANIFQHWHDKISTGRLNRWLAAALEQNPPPLGKNNRQFKIKYGTQVATRPPSFKFFANFGDDLPASYERYLRNSMSEKFDLAGVPIRMQFERSKNPYAA